MLIYDPLYGAHQIREPVLLDLLASSAMVRLKGIHQGGASYLVHEKRDGTRYEHSVGVMLLIRMLGGSVQEQIAGLIHDVSHTTFSHVGDLVFQRSSEDYHEQHFMRVLLNSDIPPILEQHGLSANTFFDMDHWSLLEQHQPDLCADRIDYALRDLARVGSIQDAEIDYFLRSLTVHAGKIVTDNLQAATWFTRQYAHLVCDLFMNPAELFAAEQLARAIRVALDQGILRDDDLFQQDEDLLRILRAAHHPDIDRDLANLHPGLTVIEDRERFDIHARVKTRVVDPLVLLEDGRVVRCSILEPDIKALHDKVIHKTSRGVYIRLVSPDLALRQ